MTILSGSLKGSGRRSVALTTLKMAVLAPMPSARVAIMSSVKLGRLARARSPCLMSCQSVPIQCSYLFISERDY